MTPNSETSRIATTINRLLRRKELEQAIGLSRSTIYARLDKNSPHYDPTFPRPVNLGSKAVAWVLADVEGWINARIAERKGA